MNAPVTKPSEPAPIIVGRSASRSIMQSFEDLSKSAVVELSPELVDGSFVADRLGGSDDEYRDLLESIRANGQDSPILVRHNPRVPGRFQAIFGHRRLSAARDLGRQVRAIIRDMPDREHLIAQGQENAARANLSFIERTMFAKQVLEQGHSTETLVAALVLDETTLSKMRSVLANVPGDLIQKIGPAKTVGRDRWWQFSKHYEHLSNAERLALMEVVVALSGSSDEKFDAVWAFASQARSENKTRSATKKELSRRWIASDKGATVTLRADARQAVVTLKAKDGPQFAAFITDRLDRLYEEFRQSEIKSTGD